MASRPLFVTKEKAAEVKEQLQSPHQEIKGEIKTSLLSSMLTWTSTEQMMEDTQQQPPHLMGPKIEALPIATSRELVLI